MKSCFWPTPVAALAAGVLLTAATAVAQDPLPAPELPPQYEVEILVFAYRDFDPNEERFPQTLNGLASAPLEALRDAPVFDDSNFGPLAASPTFPQASPSLDPAAPVDPLAEALRVRPLRPDELTLGSAYSRLRAVSAYTPLFHGGWIQPGLPEADSRPFDLAMVGAVNPRGTVRVHLSRFLHITLDLTLERADVTLGSATQTLATPLDDGLNELAVAPRYRLSATRNARSGELHYFDHPAFGVLVRVTPVPTEDAAAPGRRPAA